MILVPRTCRIFLPEIIFNRYLGKIIEIVEFVVVSEDYLQKWWTTRLFEPTLPRLFTLTKRFDFIMSMTQEQKEMYAKIKKDLEAKFEADLDKWKAKRNEAFEKEIEEYKVKIKTEVEAKATAPVAPVAPGATVVASNQSAAVLAVAHTILPFNGESKASGDTKTWCEQVDDVARTGGIDNKTTAAIAVIRFLPGSPVHRWHKFEKDEDNYPNLNIWHEETDKPGGLRKALMEVFEAKLTRND